MTSLRQSLLHATLCAVVTVSVAAPLLGRYGWDRDELYFLSASRRPALGYVDFPPLAIWLAWLVRQISGDSLIALRLVSLTAAVATVFFVVLMTRELGGGRVAQLLAGLVWAVTPYILGAASLFHPTWLDAVAWAAVVYLLTRILVRPQPRLWPVLGVVAGLGLEAKYTIVFLLGAVLISLAAFDRRVLASRGPWLAAAIALALLGPNLVWEAQHGWPSLQFAASQNAQTAADTPPATYVAEQVLFAGGALVLAVVGVLLLWRRGLRTLAAVPVIVTVAFLVERGRAYYSLPALTLAVAAGAVALERSRHRSRWIGSTALYHLAICVVAVPLIVPILPEQTLISTGAWKIGFFKDEIGWPELVRQVENVWNALPAKERMNGAVLAANYGEASALELYRRGPRPLVLSGHLSWQYWRARHLPQRYVVTVGFYADRLDRLCSRWTVVDHVRNSRNLANEELGRPIATCTLRVPLGNDWSQIASNSL